MAVIHTENLKIAYRDKLILEDINLNIEEGKIYSIIGPNGCGKTSLLRAITRGIKPTGGQVFLEGKDIYKLKSKDIAKKLGVLSQSNNSLSDISVRDLVAYGRYAHKSWWKSSDSSDGEIIDWAIRKTKLSDLQARRIGSLSGGERQRAWIAMSLAQKPKVLILDEPTTYLDISHQLEILELIKSLNEEENLTIIMVVHDINHAARYSDELVVIYNKKIYDQGNPWDILEGPVLKEVFKVEADILKELVTGKPLFHPKKVI